MPTPTIVVGLDSGERVEVDAEKVERDRDGAVRCYEDDTEIATFWDADYAIRKDNLANP